MAQRKGLAVLRRLKEHKLYAHRVRLAHIEQHLHIIKDAAHTLKKTIVQEEAKAYNTPSLYSAFLLFRHHTTSLSRQYERNIQTLRNHLTHERQKALTIFKEKKHFDILENSYRDQEKAIERKQRNDALNEWCIQKASTKNL